MSNLLKLADALDRAAKTKKKAKKRKSTKKRKSKKRATYAHTGGSHKPRKKRATKKRASKKRSATGAKRGKLTGAAKAEFLARMAAGRRKR